jgi:hypothetical protein
MSSSGSLRLKSNGFSISEARKDTMAYFASCAISSGSPSGHIRKKRGQLRELTRVLRLSVI